MNRRDLLTSLAFAIGASAAEPDASESLYIPKAHRVEDRALLHDFMDDYPFVDLVTAAPEIRITHIPVLLDRGVAPYGAIYGHVSKNNPQHDAFDGRQRAVIIFRGPNSYISPSWYARPEAVPTWNFAVAHASGTLNAVTDKRALRAFLAKLIDTFEKRYATASSYDFAKLPDNYVEGMLGGIVGFEMKIDALEGKFKLGQERSETDKSGILAHLRTAKQDPSIAELTASYYARLAKPQ